MAKASRRRRFFVFGLLAAAALILYFSMFEQFFFADDWYHLRLVQINSVSQFINFFRFQPNPQQASFYRPIPTQFFFWVNYRLFGLNSVWWFISVYLVFVFTLWLLVKLAAKLTSFAAAAAAGVVYLFSQTNFTRLYFLSAFQDLLMTFFSLASTWLFLKRRRPRAKALSLICLILALMSKESAVAVPVLLGLMYLFEHARKETKLFSVEFAKKTYKALWPYLLTVIVYLGLRLFVFGFSAASGSEYQLSLSPRLAVNTFGWYLSWSLGLAEGVVNYVAGGLKVLPRYQLDFPQWGQLHLRLFLGLLTVLGLRALSFYWTEFRQQLPKINLNRHLRQHYWLYGGLVWFIVSLLPILFFPNHKFALSLGLPLAGLALTIASLTQSKNRWRLIILLMFCAVNVTALKMNLRTHYTVLRSSISRNVFQYFQTEVELEAEDIVYFQNDLEGSPQNWGVSKQIKQALMGDEFFQVVYPDLDMKVIYQDDQPQVPPRAIEVGSKQFLQY